MNIQKIRLGDKEVMPFTICSGIITTSAQSLERIAREIPEIGILTTKSIGPEPKPGNREPIFAQYMPGGFVNAVGLTNPGAKEFANQLRGINFPKDKFLMASIFGANVEEFVYVAKTLVGLVDGLELNLSCPHATDYGMALGQDPDVVYKITKAVNSVTRKPIFAKLTPNAGNIGEIAIAAMKAGAEGISAINTVGPGYWTHEGHPVLTNKFGGMSGSAIKPIGFRCVKQISDAIGPNAFIIGMGGISTAQDVREYFNLGAIAVGIGTELIGMNDENLKNYFHALIGDLESDGNLNNASRFLQEVDMEYKKVRITQTSKLGGCNLQHIVTDFQDFSRWLTAGQFVFAMIPGVGEKPFSIVDNEPLTLGVLERGVFTEKLCSLKKGAEFYVRGPYGEGVVLNQKAEVNLVGGGCGIAGLYGIVKGLQNSKNYPVNIFLGAKTKNDIPMHYLEDFKKFNARVSVATEDGSYGVHGNVKDLLEPAEFSENCYFFNCGPKAMVKAVLPFELKKAPPERVYSSVDFMTMCGVGICGSCADKEGRRTCVEGPFMSAE